MTYKALVSFSGLVTMSAGEVGEVNDLYVADLIRAGYIEPQADEKAESPTEKPRTTTRRKK